MSSTCTDKNNPFSRCTNKTPNWKPSPNRTSIRLSQIAFPIIAPQVGVHTSCFQKEPLDLRCLPTTLAIHVVEGVSMSGHSDFGILSVLHLYLSVCRYCISCLSIATRQSGDDIMILAAVIWDADEPCSVKTV